MISRKEFLVGAAGALGVAGCEGLLGRASGRYSVAILGDTHLDSMMEKLEEPRVRRIVEPVMLGGMLSPDVTEDDVGYCLDLGLLKKTAGVLSGSFRLRRASQARGLYLQFLRGCVQVGGGGRRVAGSACGWSAGRFCPSSGIGSKSR